MVTIKSCYTSVLRHGMSNYEESVGASEMKRVDVCIITRIICEFGLNYKKSCHYKRLGTEAVLMINGAPWLVELGCKSHVKLTWPYVNGVVFVKIMNAPSYYSHFVKLITFCELVLCLTLLFVELLQSANIQVEYNWTYYLVFFYDWLLTLSVCPWKFSYKI